MNLMKWLYRVEVANKMEMEAAIDLAQYRNAIVKKGKPFGKNHRCVVYVEAEPFGGRDKLRELMQRAIPGAEVKEGELLEVVPV